MNRTDAIWAVGRATIGTADRARGAAARLRGRARPAEGGLVVASNHFSWIDPPALGAACPADALLHGEGRGAPRAGPRQLIALFGAFSVRRGESDREAVRTMREIVRDGTCARALRGGDAPALGRPGPVQPGAAMVAINEDVRSSAPRSTARTSGGSATSGRSPRLGHAADVRGAAATAGRATRRHRVEIEREIRRLWEWLAELHELGRPRDATPPS